MNKKVMIPVAVILTLGIIAAAIVWSYSIPVTTTVSEAFSSTTINLDFSGVVGNTVFQNISIHNAASVPITVNLAWSVISNPSNVNYTISMPATFEALPGDNAVPVSFTYDKYGPVGVINGNITLTRGTA